LWESATRDDDRHKTHDPTQALDQQQLAILTHIIIQSSRPLYTQEGASRRRLNGGQHPMLTLQLPHTLTEKAPPCIAAVSDIVSLF
jgi:hypothetical protein